jgi:hypothetical protein
VEELSLDEWQLALEVKKRELEACQREQKVNSCLSCSKIHDCEIRDAYVHAVYNSMSKGAGGGFEF